MLVGVRGPAPRRVSTIANQADETEIQRVEPLLDNLVSQRRLDGIVLGEIAGPECTSYRM